MWSCMQHADYACNHFKKAAKEHRCTEHRAEHNRDPNNRMDTIVETQGTEGMSTIAGPMQQHLIVLSSRSESFYDLSVPLCRNI
jgi:hypothetical protein